jgi:effector-binding domain-containing protein
VYAAEFFEAHLGEVIAFVPFEGDPGDTGAGELIELPAAELAVAVHRGSFDQLDRTYAALGAHVASRAVGVDGPIREHYLQVGSERDEDQRTEVGWPISMAQAAPK